MRIDQQGKQSMSKSLLPMQIYPKNMQCMMSTPIDRLL